MATIQAFTIVTDLGRITIQTRPDLAPVTVARLVQLSNQNFYDNQIFHRVIDGFVAQTGDPTGTGRSGSGQTLPAEFTATPYERGTVGMARAQSPTSGDSQFFITYTRQASLDNQYTVWGSVVNGMDVADRLQRGEPPANPSRMLDTIVEQLNYEPGSSANDSILGSNSLPNLLLGSGGDDSLTGGALSDTLDGGAGTNVMTGGAGNDVFQILRGDGGTNRITDFQVGDRVEVRIVGTGAAQTPGLSLTTADNRTTVTLTASNTAAGAPQVILDGVWTAAMLSWDGSVLTALSTPSSPGIQVPTAPTVPSAPTTPGTPAPSTPTPPATTTPPQAPAPTPPPVAVTPSVTPATGSTTPATPAVSVDIDSGGSSSGADRGGPASSGPGGGSSDGFGGGWAGFGGGGVGLVGGSSDAGSWGGDFGGGGFSGSGGFGGGGGFDAGWS